MMSCYNRTNIILYYEGQRGHLRIPHKGHLLLEVSAERGFVILTILNFGNVEHPYIKELKME